MPDQSCCFTPASPRSWLPTQETPFEVHRLPFPDPRRPHPGIAHAAGAPLIGTWAVGGTLTANIGCCAFVQMCLLSDDADDMGSEWFTVFGKSNPTA